MQEISVSDDDIGDQLDHCCIAHNKGKSVYPGLTYEHGVEAAILWLTGNTDEPPIDPDDLYTKS